MYRIKLVESDDDGQPEFLAEITNEETGETYCFRSGTRREAMMGAKETIEHEPKVDVQRVANAAAIRIPE